MALDELEAEPGYVKGGFLGETSSGKTTTAMMLAIAIRRHFKLEGPISMFDSEGGSQYVKGWVRELTGKPLLGKRARSFGQMMEWGHDSIKAGAAIGIVDSIAHPWEELKESFLADINAARKAKKWDPRALEFQDWAKIKPMWGKWTEFYLNCPMHIIVCGRAGDIYAKEMNPETGRKELSITGTRMQTEKNFGYEPSLLVEMSREQILEPQTHFVRRAVVWKDRFGVIDGKSCDFPVLGNREKEIAAVWAFFSPAIDRLAAGSDTSIDLGKTQTGADEGGDDGWAREKKERTILSEEVQGEINAAIPGMSADEKKQRSQLIFDVFGTRSWTAVENMQSFKLRDGLDAIRKRFSPKNTLTLTPEPSLEEEARARELAETTAQKRA